MNAPSNPSKQVKTQTIDVNGGAFMQSACAMGSVVYFCHNRTCFFSTTQVKNVLMNFYLEKPEKNAFVANFGQQIGSKLLKNTVLGLAASNYPYLDNLPGALAFRGAKQ